MGLQIVKKCIFWKKLNNDFLTMGHMYFDCILPDKHYNEKYDAKLNHTEIY